MEKERSWSLFQPLATGFGLDGSTRMPWGPLPFPLRSTLGRPTLSVAHGLSFAESGPTGGTGIPGVVAMVPRVRKGPAQNTGIK
jgi:hypothetical protein